jgi:precorrin-6B methylase 2
MVLWEWAGLILGVGFFCPGSYAAHLRSRRLSASRQICQFGIYRDGQTRNDIASDSNVVFRSNDVLVVQEGPQRIMIFLRNGGQDGTSKEPYCHEQAEIACGDASSRPNRKVLLQSQQDGNSSAACSMRQACSPASNPDLSYIRSMLGGAIVSRKGEIKRVASIGLGAGTIPLFWSRMQPNTTVEAIDISADVIAAAPCFGVRQSTRLQLIQKDGRKYIESQPDGSYDVIFVDAFDNLDVIPACLKTVEFFQMVSKKLAPGGVLSMNVWRREVNKVYTAFAMAFPGRTQVGQSPGLGNVVLLGRAAGGASITRITADSDSNGLDTARSWAIQADFGSNSADGADGSRTVQLLRAQGHDLKDSKPDPQLDRDIDICPSYAPA